MIFERLDAASQPDEAAAAFENFLSGLPAGVQLFALFEANPQLIDLIIDIVGSAPALAEHLGRNSAVLDAVLGGDFFADWPGLGELRADLAKAMAAVDGYEGKLDTARRFMKEWHLVFCKPFQDIEFCFRPWLR